METKKPRGGGPNASSACFFGSYWVPECTLGTSWRGGKKQAEGESGGGKKFARSKEMRGRGTEPTVFLSVTFPGQKKKKEGGTVASATGGGNWSFVF